MFEIDVYGENKGTRVDCFYGKQNTHSNIVCTFMERYGTIRTLIEYHLDSFIDELFYYETLR